MTTGDDIVAILERLALSAETSKHLTLYGQMRLMPAAGVCDIIHQAMDTIVDLRVELEEAKWLLRGTIAKPTVEQIVHLYGVDALAKALAPVIVREAGIEPAPAPDLSDPVVVHANMLRGTIAKPTVEQIVHLYGRDALTKVLVGGLLETLKQEIGQPAPDPAAIREAALREAARLVSARCDAYVAEHGSYDYSTGTTEYPGDGAEWVEEWTDIESAILALIPKGAADDRA